MSEISNSISINSISKLPPLDEVKDRVRDIPIQLTSTPSPFLADARVFPFNGILNVAAEARKNGNQVSVLDLAGFSLEACDQIIDEYKREFPSQKNFALTATTPQLPYAVYLSKRIKEKIPDSKIILGGPHVTLTHTAYQIDNIVGKKGRGYHAFKQLGEHFDTLVSGDGEMAIFYAIDPENRDHLIDASNLKSDIYMKRGTLDNYEFPARDLIDIYSYNYQIDGHRAFSVISQLGCPYGCGFCGGRDSEVYRAIRTRSVENVIDEIKQVVTQSFVDAISSNDPSKAFTAVMFYDDELNVSRDKVTKRNNLEIICEKLIDLQKELAKEYAKEIKALNLKTETDEDGEEKLTMRFRGFVKAEQFSQKQADLMSKAGFKEVLSGVESGSDLMLRAMQKGTTRDINKKCVEYAHKAGLGFKALMSIGHPGESFETIAESVEWALSNLTPGMDTIDWTIITQYPGSPYFDRSEYSEEKNLWLYKIKDKVTDQILNLWSFPTDFTTQVHNYKGIPGNYIAYVRTDTLSPEQLVELRDNAEEVTRDYLGLSPIESVAEKQFEHSMGQSLPPHILRESTTVYQA